MLARLALLAGLLTAATALAQPAPSLQIELNSPAAAVVLGNTTLFTFTVRNLVSGSDFVYSPRYRLGGSAAGFTGDTSDVARGSFLISDTISYQLTAAAVGRYTVTLSVDYVECTQSGAVCVPRSVSQPFVLDIVPPPGSATATLTPVVSVGVATATASGATATATASATVTLSPTPATGLTYELAVFPAQPVVGDLVSFVFTVRNPQSGVSANRPTYTISGLSPNFDGDLTAITSDVAIAGPQTDTVVFRHTAVRDGVTQLRVNANYLECRQAQCHAGSTLSPIYPILVRGSALTPVTTVGPEASPTATATASLTLTPTLSPEPSLTTTVTPVLTPDVTPTASASATTTGTPSASTTATPSASTTATPSATSTQTATPVDVVMPALAFDLAFTPVQPAVGDRVTFVFTVRNTRADTQAVRPSYQVTGTSPNFSGQVMAVVHDGAIGGDSLDAVTYELIAVHPGTTLLQLHVSYEVCVSDPCSYRFTSSEIYRIVVAEPPSPTPTVTATATASPSNTATPTITVDPFASVTASPSPTEIPPLVGTLSDGDCSVQAVHPGARGGVAPVLWAVLAWLLLRRRSLPHASRPGCTAIEEKEA